MIQTYRNKDSKLWRCNACNCKLDKGETGIRVGSEHSFMTIMLCCDCQAELRERLRASYCDDKYDKEEGYEDELRKH